VKYAPVIPNPQLQPLMDIDDFCRLTGTSRTKGYMLAKANKLPVPVVRVGSSYRIPTAKLLAALGLSETA
jgi:excisionase family DNA binding protein